MSEEKKVPTFFDGSDEAKGFEDINQETMAIPFIKISQSLSPEMKKNKPEFIEGLELGKFFNSVTKDIYGDKIKVVVGKFERIYIEWLPDRGGFVGYHSPEHAETIATDKTFGKWKHGENNLTEQYVYYIVIVGREQEGVMIMSLSSTQIKKAKKWNRLLTSQVLPNGQKALPYYLVWDVSIAEESDGKNDWYGVSISYAGLVDEAQYLSVKEERKMIAERSVDYAQLEGPQGVEEAEDGEDSSF